MEAFFPASNGTLQSDRYSFNLLSGAPAIDGKSPQDFLNFVHGFSELLTYWNLNNLPEGDWKRFFNQDLSFILANIMNKDLSPYPPTAYEISQEFYQTNQLQNKELAAVRLLEIGLELGQTVMSWYSSIKEQAILHSINKPLAGVIEEELTSKIWKPSLIIKEYYFSMIVGFTQNPNQMADQNLEPAVNKLFHQLEELWTPNLLGTEELTLIQNTYENGNLDDLLGYFMKVYEGFYGAAYLLQKHAPTYILSSLRQPNHSPQVSLLLALFRMMEPLKENLNRFLPQHLDFYFRQVLLLNPKNGEPDLFPLHFELNDPTGDVVHPKGTLLSTSPEARNNDKSKIKPTAPKSYVTQSKVKVSGARIVAFKTLFNGTLSDSASFLIASPEANSRSGMGGKILKTPPSWPSFGREKITAQEQSVLSNTTPLGWALASPRLNLSEGTRTLEISWNCDPEILEDLKNSFAPIMTAKQLCAYLEACFQLSYTSKKDWVLIKEYTITLSSHPLILKKPESDNSTLPKETQPQTQPNTASGIVFNIILSLDDPACDVYNSKTHGLGFDTNWPVIKACLIQEPIQSNSHPEPFHYTGEYPNPYSHLVSLPFSSPSVQVMVEGIKTYSAQNDFSILSPKKPFALLGIKPVLGSSFYLGNSEVFSPGLTSFEITLDWYDLPSQSNGFSDYYTIFNKYYGKKGTLPYFTNAAFQWGACLLVDKGKWSPLMPLAISDQKNTTDVSAQVGTKEVEGSNTGDNDKPDPPIIPKNDCTHSPFPMFEWDPSTDPPTPSPSSGLPQQIEEIDGALKSIKDGLGQALNLANEIWNILKWWDNGKKATSEENATKKTVSQQSPEKNEDPAGEAQNESAQTPTYDGKLKSSSRFRFKVSETIDINEKSNSSEKKKESGKYTLKATSGFLRFVLLTPTHAFGQDLYMKTLAEVANANISIIANGGAVEDSVTKEKNDSAAEEAVESLIPGGNWIGKAFKALKGIFLSVTNSARALKKRVDALQKMVIMEASLTLPPNPPFIPKVKKVTIDFVGNALDGEIEVFHIHPFGIKKHGKGITFPLVPVYKEAGYLFIGLQHIKLPEQISMLFFLNEGSGNRNEALPAIKWSVLDGNKWVDLPAISVQDDSMGFARSGIIDFSLPLPSSRDNTWPISLIPAEKELFWLRATVAQDPGAVSEIIEVFPHAILAQATSPEIPAAPLPTDSFLSETQASISPPQHPYLSPPIGSKTQVKQSVPPRKGKPIESIPQFYARTSERLRHKNRALSCWDFEHLILENFPQIGYVKCLRHTSIKEMSICMPGHTSVLILPLNTQKGILPFTPKTNSFVVEQISEYLARLISPQLSLQVQNPDYETIKVQAVICFSEEIDTGKVLKAINEQLVKVIAPWVSDPEAKPFEHSFSYFSLLTAVETFLGVEKVLKFDVFKQSLGESPSSLLPITFDPVRSTHPWTLLSSSPKHILTDSCVYEDEESLLKISPPIIKSNFAPSSEKEKNSSASDSQNKKTATEIGANALFIRNDLYNEK